MAIRIDFPKEGVEYEGGKSNGWEYKLLFAGASYQRTYEMVIAFLEEEGYGDIPLPKNAKELLLFRKKIPKGQLRLFGDNGYVHNPIKIIFPTEAKKRASLLLCLYKDDEPNHLLRFHRVVAERE